MFCIQCGTSIKDTANFCKYCGAKVKKPATPAVTPTTTVPTPAPKQTEEQKPFKPPVEPPRFITKEESLFSQTVMTEDEPVTQPLVKETKTPLTSVDPFLQDQDEKFDPITDETIDVLYSRERDNDIKDDLKENLAEVERIEQRLNLGLLSKDEAAAQIQDKQNLMTALKAERKSLKNEKILIETLSEEIKELQTKLDKLLILKNEGKISHDTVYAKLKGEYADSLSKKKADYEQQRINITHWLKILEFDVLKMNEDIYLVSSKAYFGETSKDEAETKKSELEIDIYRKDLAYQALKKVQEKITS